MKLLITGGAGFIGTNFVLYWLKNHPDDYIVNFDKLTYAGNLANLTSVANNPHYLFIKGDICDLRIVDEVMDDIVRATGIRTLDSTLSDVSRYMNERIA